MYEIKGLTNVPGLGDIIAERLSHVTFSIDKKIDVPAQKMMEDKELYGWCWQTVTFLSVFFDDDSVSTKGYINLGGKHNIFHNWIEIKYRGRDYVFDPAYDWLEKKEVYYALLGVRLKNKIATTVYHDALMAQIREIGPNMHVIGDDNPENPFFRTNSEARIITDGNMIKSLKAKFLMSEQRKAIYDQHYHKRWQ